MDRKLLAYETGVHIGDGNLYITRRMARLTYSGDLRNEKRFYTYILSKSLQKLYGIRPLYYERKSDNTVLLIINSKRIAELKTRFGLTSGSKKEIRIPAWIRNDRKLLAACLRGLGDTDFSLSFKKNRKGKYTEPRLELYAQSQRLLKDVATALRVFGFTFSTETVHVGAYVGFRLRVYGKQNLDRWLKLIGFSNPYVAAKISFWKKRGYFIPRKNYSWYCMSASPSG